MGPGAVAWRRPPLRLAAMAMALESSNCWADDDSLSCHGLAREHTTGSDTMESRRLSLEWLGSRIGDGGCMMDRKRTLVVSLAIGLSGLTVVSPAQERDLTD